MNAKLTPEQLAKIAAHPGQPISVVGEASGGRFYLIPDERLTHLEAAVGEESDATLTRLRKLIAEANAAPDIEANVFRERVETMLAERLQSTGEAGKL